METPSSKGPDEEGYYEVVLHNFNVPSINGRKYLLDDLTLNAIERVGKRAAQGRLYAEFGNPDLSQVEGRIGRRQRIYEIREDRICAGFKNLTLEDGVVKGEAKLLGPFGKVAEELLKGDTPTFGMRATTRTNPGTDASLMQLVTFDFINPDK